MKTDYLLMLRRGDPLSLRQQLSMIVRLSLPAIMAYVSSIVMQYIDASMVGQLGLTDSASIGLVSSSTWLFGGVCADAVMGFSVQVAQEIGAGDDKTARSIMKQAFVFPFAFAVLIGGLGALISPVLPRWLGAEVSIHRGATLYFLLYCLSLPAVQINTVSGAMLQASGNMRLPSLLHVLMCGLDVLFNLLLIFPSRVWHGIPIPGAGLGIIGAALGTALSQAVIAIPMTIALLARSPALHLRRGERFTVSRVHLVRAVRIALPLAAEQCVLSGAQIVSTRIVAPLGTVSITAHSFSITAESLCYMPGYGIGSAAATLIGQSTGAGRRELTRRLGWLTTLLGMAVMAVMAVLMYIAAPVMIGILSPDPDVVALGTAILRIEAFAEPLYAASIVASGVFRGTGDTLIPSILNFGSMWLVRLPLAAFMAPRIGLRGVWIAMAIELCVRGALFLIRLAGKRWQKDALRTS